MCHFNLSGVGGILTFLYLVGIGMKCFFTVFEEYADVTKNLKDNELFTKMVTSSWYLALCFLFDLTVRIKLPRLPQK